jgi:hypothetical protein
MKAGGTMRNSDDLADREGARAELRAIATEFCRAAGPATDAALHSRLQALVEAEAEWFEAIEPAEQAAFRVAADRAIANAVAEVERRLAEEDLWLDPLTAPGWVPATESGWNTELPEWVIGFLRLLSRKDTRPRLNELDDPANRVWILFLAAAKPLDPVLEEFGLPPSEIPNLGGGNYGLSPRNAAQLDPSGTLARLWNRYRIAYEQYRALLPKR